MKMTELDEALAKADAFIASEETAQQNQDVRAGLLRYFEGRGWKVVADADGIWEIETTNGKVWSMTIPQEE